MVYLARICTEDFDNYDWPDSIKNRNKSKKNQGMRTTVKETVKANFKMLAKEV